MTHSMCFGKGGGQRQQLLRTNWPIIFLGLHVGPCFSFSWTFIKRMICITGGGVWIS